MAFSAPMVSATEEGISVGVTVDYLGKYIWRGQNLSDDPVVQPGVSVDFQGFTAGVWGNLDTTSINDQNGEFTEYDYSLDYSGDMPFVEGVGFSVGVIRYCFPSAGNTTEVYWGLGWDVPLAPAVTVYHDIDAVDGTYVSLNIGHTIETVFELSPEITANLELAASLGWGSASYNRDYWGDDVDSVEANDLVLSLALPIDIRGWTLTPRLCYITLVDDSIRASNAFSSSSDYVFGGIGLSKSF